MLSRPSFFGAGRPSNIYVTHVEKACLLVGVDTSWKARAVATVGYGLATAGDRPFTPRPAISKVRLRDLVPSVTLLGGLALIALIGWPFLLRILSEWLPLSRHRAGVDHAPEIRLARRGAIGLSGAQLAIKLKMGKRMAASSRPA